MTVSNMTSESLVENLFKEIDLIKSRTQVIRENLTKTNNDILKKRLKKEYLTLHRRLGEIQNISLHIFKITNHEICLSSLLVEKCKRFKLENHNNKELFFT